MTPTARSMKLLRDRGYIVCRVEQRVPHSFRTRDAFNFGDLLAAACATAETFGTIALVQVTTASHLANRERKARDLTECWRWIRAGGRVFLHGWAKKGPRGKRKVWTCTEREIC